MLPNIKSFRLSGLGETLPVRVRGSLFVLLVLSIATQCPAQGRILDLGEVGPEDFQEIKQNSGHTKSSEARFFLPPLPTSDLSQSELVFLPPILASDLRQSEMAFLPPMPVTDLSLLDTVTKVGVFDLTAEPFEVEEAFLLPPAVEEAEIQFTSAEQSEESLGNRDASLVEQVVDVEDEAISQLAGEYEVLSPESETIERVSYAEMPIIATHKVLGVAHQCSTAIQAPVGNSWIYWRKERSPGPICCSLQSRFVNWRLSSTYLQGCIPEGYSLRYFIETSPNVEFHASTLAENGPVDPGGSFKNAKLIEGDETKPIQQVSINITPPKGELPANRAEEKFDQLPLQRQFPGTHRLWCGTSFYWNASLLNHQPLYFEDVNLERHGFSRGCLMQPLVSGVKFFGTLPALPYLMAAGPPNETSFTLGQSRPGSHACYVCERPRLRLDAAAVEAAAVVGLVFLIP